jgi:hypothetical protein
MTLHPLQRQACLFPDIDHMEEERLKAAQREQQAVYNASMIKPQRPRRTRANIARIRDAIHETLSKENPMTVRQVFYRLVSQGVIDKTENEYTNTVVRLLVDMRLQGDVPFGWIADNTRWLRKPKSYSSAERALQNCAETYRRSLWDNQNVYVEVWTEKDAMAGVLWEETKKWDVPLMVSRGFASLSFLYSAAENIVDVGKPAFLYYFGDHDPSGVRIDRTIKERLGQFAPDAEITFERVAVLPRQIEELNLPTRPTKKSGTHGKGFKGRSVEVDAIPSRTLRDMACDCIERHIDRRHLKALKETERLEREQLRQVAAAFGETVD